jgi:hypothetical protein
MRYTANVSCTDCNRKGGCEAHKEPQRRAIADVLASLYPDRTWGRPDDEARFRAGIRPAEARKLARAVAAAARAPVFVRDGGPEDLCHYIYVLCLGRVPALVDVRDGLAPPEADRVRERYLRLHLSTMARLATIQEVAMELDRDGNDWVLRELPLPGVYDAKLLKRMRAIVDLVEAHDIEHLDFGLVDKPAPEAQPGEYVERYGVEPALVNFLFYAQPARTSSITVLSP